MSLSSSFFAQDVVKYNMAFWKMKANREAFAKILSGDPAGAVRMMEEYLANGWDVPEIYYGMSVAYFYQKDQVRGMEYFRKALQSGIPVERFMAGPRGVLKPLFRSREFQDKIKGKELIHGPMLGSMTGRTVKVWIRTFHEVSFSVKVGRNPFLLGETSTFWGQTSREKDYTGVALVTGLEPGTEYYYSLDINGKKTTIRSFRTFPVPGSPSTVKVAFGGGAFYNPQKEKIWNVIRNRRPDMFIGMGDNVYIDHPEMPVVQRFCYYQRESSLPFRRMTAVIPYFSVWDDHDFGVNDSYGGPDPFKPAWKTQVLEVYKENTVNAAYGGGTDHPGTWYSVSLGDVEFFMLDTRYYRTPSWVDPEKAAALPAPDMLGPVQMAWLKKALKNSDAVFKVIISSVPWADGAKEAMEGRYDTWRGYSGERREIFNYITANNIGGVVLLSADRHRHDVWKHDRADDYPLYEFTSSRLTNEHYHALRPGALFGYNEKCGFGYLEFHTDVAKPYVVYKIINIDNVLIDEIRVYRFQLEKAFVMPEKKIGI